MSAKTILDAALKHQVYLERVKNGVSKEFKSTIVKKLNKNINSMFSTLSEEGTQLSKVDRKRLGKFLEEMKQVQSEVMVEAIDDLSGKLEDISKYSVTYEEAALRGATEEKVYKVGDAKKTFENALKDPLTSVSNEKASLDKFMGDWTKKEIKSISDTIRNGFSSGATNDEIIAAIRGTKEKGYKDGLVQTTSRHAETMVRTSIQQVASNARAEVWENNDDLLEGYKIVATLDGETTEICRGLDGQVFPVGDGPMPPFHYNCRSTTVAVLKEEFAFLSEGRTRSSIDGPVSAKQTYYDWLKDQKPEYQKEVLGGTRATLFRDGGLSPKQFGELTLNQKFQPMTIAQMREKMPKAFEKAGL